MVFGEVVDKVNLTTTLDVIYTLVDEDDLFVDVINDFDYKSLLKYASFPVVGYSCMKLKRRGRSAFYDVTVVLSGSRSAMRKEISYEC